MKQIFTLFTFFVAFVSMSQSLVINEVMPKNGNALYDSYGENEDWVEIYNASNLDVDLSNYYISNSQSNKLKWRLPNVMLPSGDFLLVYCSGRNEAVGEFHSNFKLNNSNTTVGIYFANGATIHELTYDSMPENISYGPQTDGGSNLKFFSMHTAAYSNSNETGYDCFTPVPELNKVSGRYPSPLPIQLVNSGSGTTVRFNNQGQEPTVNSPVFTATNLVTSNVPNVWSTVPTNPGLNAPIADYTVTRMNTRGYLPPHVDGQNVNVLSLKAFQSGCISSKVTKYTYVLDNGQVDYGTMPIMSLTINNNHLFSNDSGMYVFGNHPEGNYTQVGGDWEREGYFQYFDEQGVEQINQRLGVELHGNGSRHSTHKNFRLSAKTMYGKKQIENTVFSESALSEYKSLILRSSGHRPDCAPRDEFATEIVKGLHFDYQEYKTGVLYINGEYWGINTLKERFNEDYLTLKYGVNSDQLVLLKNSGTVEHGFVADEVHYENLIDYAGQNNLNDSIHYAYVASQMDLSNYFELMAAQIYMGNGDWPYNNMRFWRKRTPYNSQSSLGHDGRWRWMFFDSDGSFGGSCEYVNHYINNLERALTDTGIYEDYTKLFINLMQHENVRNEYINMSCDLLNSYFSAQVVRPKFDVIEQNLSPEMQRNVERWGYPSVATTLQDRMVETPSLQKWMQLVSGFEDFSIKRPFYVRRQMLNEWQLSDTSEITLNVNNQQMGSIQINNIEITASLPGVTTSVYPWRGQYFDNVPLTLTAKAKPGYRFKFWQPSGDTNHIITMQLNGNAMYMAVFEVDPNYVPLQPLMINELLADNENNISDEFLEKDDWFEIYNPNASAVDLNGYYLTDNPNNLTKYKLGPNEVLIDANGFLLLWADDQTGQGVLHTNFKLNKDGEYIALVEPDGQTIMSDISFGPQTTDVSYGSEIDGTSPWITFIYPTPMYSNLATDVAKIQQNAFNVYPNPVKNGRIYFDQVISGTIYSVSGVALKHFTNTAELDVHDLPSGVYWVRNSENAQVSSFIVQ